MMMRPRLVSPTVPLRFRFGLNDRGVLVDPKGGLFLLRCFKGVV